MLYALEKIKARSDILLAIPDYKFSLCEAEATASGLFSMWGHEKIQLTDALDIKENNNTVIVGVLDTGIDGNHASLSSQVNIELSRDFTKNDYLISESIDYDGHGTNVAGIIGSQNIYPIIGIHGVCLNTQLVSLRVFAEDDDYESDGADSFLSRLIIAINYAETQNIPILNFSGSAVHYTNNIGELLYQTIENYSGLFVCSAGNAGQNNDLYDIIPSNYDLPNLISVGASNSNDQPAQFNSTNSSNYGQQTVDIFAPGYEIATTGLGNSFVYVNGTSMAAPFVARVAALLLSENPNLSAEEIKHIIMNNVDECSELADKCVSGGRLNAYKALSNICQHSYEYLYQGSGINHTVICTRCNFSYRENHNLKIIQYNNRQHEVYCSKCDYYFYESHIWNSDYTRCTECKYSVFGSLWSLKEINSNYLYKKATRY